MALIGIAICLMYQRSQTMALMLSVLVAAAAWPALAEQAPWALGPALAWWALAYTINALWAERSSVLLDLAARLGLMASGAAAIALAGKARRTSSARWPCKARWRAWAFRSRRWPRCWRPA